jgi:murein DD-endopeptidase MepM/ murein hydrolase activator NlpD
MSTDLVSGVDPSAPSGTPAAAARRAKVRELAEQFEAMLLTQMLRQMRQSMLSDDSDSGDSTGFGSRTMTETIDSALALSLSRSSRLGLADFMVRAFERQAAPAAPASTAPASTAPDPLEEGGTDPDGARVGSVPSLPAPPTGPVTSGFGWRDDPITGQPRFHSGTDVRMAYGQDVLAAAGGRVASVGTQGGYGLTVVVDHGRGIETRYAHLSSAPIKTGDLVESGQVIAQSGNSGRSTGPHLHFEVLDNGQAVNPQSRAALLAAAALSD